MNFGDPATNFRQCSRNRFGIGVPVTGRTLLLLEFDEQRPLGFQHGPQIGTPMFFNATIVYHRASVGGEKRRNLVECCAGYLVLNERERISGTDQRETLQARRILQDLLTFVDFFIWHSWLLADSGELSPEG